MKRFFNATLAIAIIIMLLSCQETVKNSSSKTSNSAIDYSNISPKTTDGMINAIIEIPAGTNAKWELNKETNELTLEEKNGKPRIVNYIGYPGNYGMIPQTILPKELGGDGDPLDVIVLGPSVKRGAIQPCKLIGVLLLEDHGEQDDKLIAISRNSPLFHVNDMIQLEKEYPGISTIIETWFTNYKGPGKMISRGFESKDKALEILHKAIAEK